MKKHESIVVEVKVFNLLIYFIKTENFNKILFCNPDFKFKVVPAYISFRSINFSNLLGLSLLF
jgi:hypothetical protein